MGEPRFKALLIGNARFDRDPHNLPELQGPPEDLKLLERALADPDTGLHLQEDVVALLDGTSSEVREAIDDFFHGAGPDDQLLFFYSGHGRQDANNNLFLCARDTRTDRLVSTAVSDLDINQMSQGSHAARTLIILDCCHSGSFKGGGVSPALSEPKGRFVLTSCRNHQLATDAHVVGGASAFTSHLVQAMLSTEVDTNHDGYVTLHEVYREIHPKLKEATKQIPQLIYDKTIGDPPLCKAKRRKDAEPSARASLTARPVLAVSDTKIEISDVQLGDSLPAVMIDVFNEGDGRLDWTASTEDPWIKIQPEQNFFRISFEVEKPGTHHGNIYVRDSGRGGSKRISVQLKVLKPAPKPVLSLAETKIDFGTVNVGSKVAPQVVAIANKGSGELRARARCSNPALSVRVTDKAVTIDPDLSKPGSLAGDVEVSSDGGSEFIKVTGEVEAGPLLAVKPGKTLDFGKVAEDVLKWKKLTIVNAGTGDLEWEVEKDGDFFSAEYEGEWEVKVSVAGNPPGDYLGSILIRSNGGEATVNVRAQIVPSKRTAPPPPPPPVLPDLSGWWQNPNGRILVSGRAPEFQYADYNAFGVQVGGGVMQINGNMISVQGTSLMIPYNGQFSLNGPMMSGVINILGSQNPVVYTRC